MHAERVGANLVALVMHASKPNLDLMYPILESYVHMVEGMQDKCKAGGIVATKHPAYFCDFNYAVAYNSYNSAICVYSGALKPERTTEKS